MSSCFVALLLGYPSSAFGVVYLLSCCVLGCAICASAPVSWPPGVRQESIEQNVHMALLEHLDQYTRILSSSPGMVLCACLKVIRRADELAARVRQDPTDENAHMALLRHLEEYAAEHSALLPLVEEELARLGLDSEESDPGRLGPDDPALSSRGPRSRQQGRPTGAAGAPPSSSRAGAT